MLPSSLCMADWAWVPIALRSFEENTMLVTFTTNAYADITMFGDVAPVSYTHLTLPTKA